MTERRRAFITGITGQDGSYLTDLLLSKDYEVHGVIRRSSSFNTGRIEHYYVDPNRTDPRLTLHYGDLLDGGMLRRLIETTQPHEIYNLGAQSHVRVSFDIPEYTSDVVALGTLRLLEAVRDSRVSCRYYQASSSEMFGKAPGPQNERTPFYPRSPYGVAKLFGHWMTVNYREAYGLHASSGILFNHESPRRGKTFVTRKITSTLARILAGKERALLLGNLDARRDWGYAPEFVEAMWRMLQQPEPGDYVIATGETRSIREFLDEAFGLVGLDWTGYVGHDPHYERPTEVELLLGDASKARQKLGWEPKVRFKEIIRLMVEADLKAEGLDPAKFMVKEQIFQAAA